MSEQPRVESRAMPAASAAAKTDGAVTAAPRSTPWPPRRRRNCRLASWRTPEPPASLGHRGRNRRAHLGRRLWRAFCRPCNQHCFHRRRLCERPRHIRRPARRRPGGQSARRRQRPGAARRFVGAARPAAVSSDRRSEAGGPVGREFESGRGGRSGAGAGGPDAGRPLQAGKHD